MKSFQFEVRVVPLETYPDLVTNPANPYTQMTEEDRLEELIEIMGLVWAETCLDKTAKCSPPPKEEKKRMDFSVVSNG